MALVNYINEAQAEPRVKAVFDDIKQTRQVETINNFWLALANDHPVGFILAEAHATSLFIVELSVHLDWQGKGIGRQLINAVADHAREGGLSSLTLTTFRDVPWNAPFYARLGFDYVTELTPELRQKREDETAHGLAFDSRCAMRLPL